MYENHSILLDPRVLESDGSVVVSPGWEDGSRMPFVDLREVVRLQLTCMQLELRLHDLEPAFSLTQDNQLPIGVRQFDPLIARSLYWLEMDGQVLEQWITQGCGNNIKPETLEALTMLNTIRDRMSHPSDPTLG